MGKSQEKYRVIREYLENCLFDAAVKKTLATEWGPRLVGDGIASDEAQLFALYYQIVRNLIHNLDRKYRTCERNGTR